ncbi:MAG: hypothetical protein F4Y87_00720, partial [Synechococcus sp. SB0665_bin_28]|nr:hypothetical protein [Synechococcus sp. SB0665_bin_28]
MPSHHEEANGDFWKCPQEICQPKESFRRQLEAALASHQNVSHPLFVELSKSEQKDLLKLVALQGYQLTKYFAIYIGGLYYHYPIAYYRKRLAVNLYEEETGKLSGTANHQVLMERFIRALNISDFERDSAIALPTTQDLIYYRRQLVNNPLTFHMGAAAVMIASEGQNLEREGDKLRHDFFSDAYSLTSNDMIFFSVHAKEDIYHVKEGLDLVSEICTDSKMQHDALAAVHETCKLFWRFYDGIYNEHQLTHTITQNLTDNKEKLSKKRNNKEIQNLFSGDTASEDLVNNVRSTSVHIQNSVNDFSTFHAAFHDLENLLLCHK